MNFTSYYTENPAVYKTLEEMDPSMYQKYMDWVVKSAPAGGTILDVGCGTGYVANTLARQGLDVSGIDANTISLTKAQQGPAKFFLASDYRLPFPSESFDVVGSYTVLEHIGDPELFLGEQVRVVKKGGVLIVGCPNFMQVVGLASHHPRTRGLRRKAINAFLLASKALRYAFTGTHQFEMMEPIIRDAFEPDDDAIVATNAIDICATLRSAEMRVEYTSGTDHYQNDLIERLGTIPGLRSIVGGVFVVARKLR
jgi:2-polyprenyl-3-methyl-5-hydroxy-6-metoxy-1,4-benzoquinol methylase